MDDKYFGELAEREGEAASIPFREVALDEWKPQKNDCHRNVDRWVQAHPESRAVRGWVFWKPTEGRYTFMAHSVIETAGKLQDITPIDEQTPREKLLFIEYKGNEADFLGVKDVCSRVDYPPLTMDEWRQAQTSPIEDFADDED